MSSGQIDSSTSWAPDAERLSLLSILDERDLRYSQRFEAQQEALSAALLASEKAANAALSAAERAVLKAEVSTERRFDGVNEFRAALSDQASLLMPRSEFETSLRNLSEKLEDSNKRVSEIGSRLDLMTGQNSGANVGSRLETISKQMEANTGSIISSGGVKQGGIETRTMVFGFVAFLVGLLALGGFVFSLNKTQAAPSAPPVSVTSPR